MGSGKWNLKYQFFKKTCIDLLVFQMLISFILFYKFTTSVFSIFSISFAIFLSRDLVEVDIW